MSPNEVLQAGRITCPTAVNGLVAGLCAPGVPGEISEPTPTGPTPVTEERSQPTATLPPTAGATEEPPEIAVQELIDRLQSQGARASLPRPIRRGNDYCLDREPVLLELEGARVWVFVFQSEGQAEEVRGRIRGNDVHSLPTPGPDGTHIVRVCHFDFVGAAHWFQVGRYIIRYVDSDSVVLGHLIALTGEGTPPAPSTAETVTLLYAGQTPEGRVLVGRLTLPDGRAETVHAFEGPAPIHAAISPDGRELLWTRSYTSGEELLRPGRSSRPTAGGSATPAGRPTNPSRRPGWSWRRSRVHPRPSGRCTQRPTPMRGSSPSTRRGRRSSTRPPTAPTSSGAGTAWGSPWSSISAWSGSSMPAGSPPPPLSVT